MKKMILGMMFFCSGFIGALSLIIVCALKPWTYNGITGLKGSLLGTGTMSPFILFCVMSIVGVLICGYQAYLEK